jgi:hypothetical protein
MSDGTHMFGQTFYRDPLALKDEPSEHRQRPEVAQPSDEQAKDIYFNQEKKSLDPIPFSITEQEMVNFYRCVGNLAYISGVFSLCVTCPMVALLLYNAFLCENARF